MSATKHQSLILLHKVWVLEFWLRPENQIVVNSVVYRKFVLQFHLLALQECFESGLIISSIYNMKILVKFSVNHCSRDTLWEKPAVFRLESHGCGWPSCIISLQILKCGRVVINQHASHAICLSLMVNPLRVNVLAFEFIIKLCTVWPSCMNSI